jgi:hypothetical protein
LEIKIFLLKFSIDSKYTIIIGGGASSSLLHWGGSSGGVSVAVDLWCGKYFVFLWVVDLDEIWHELEGTVWHNSLNITHDLNLKSKNTLSHENMSNGGINEFSLWLTGRDQIS